MYSDSPRTLGKYRLIAEIARGGMGIVYLAMLQGPSGFSKLLVVKELQAELVEEPAFLEMFLEEARLAARLNHSNVVQTNEVGNDGNRYYMAMDYLDGRGLERVRRRARHVGKPLSLALQVRVLCEVLAGLEYAHNFADFDGTALGIVHRDVSPQNIFITFEGQVKILDFGIAKTIDSTNETRAGVLKGKLSYMAPEQARGERVDSRADVFAVGVVLWEALTGKQLRAGQTEHQILGDLIAKITPSRASTIKADVPVELDEICARALSPDRADRYHSAAALQADLEAYLATTKPVTSRELGTTMRELFHDDRARTSAMIEQYVANARSGGSYEEDDLPIIDVSYSPNDTRTPVTAGEHPIQSSAPGFSAPGHQSASGLSANRQVGTLDHAIALQPAVTAPSQQYPAMPPRARSALRFAVYPAVVIASVLAGGLIYTLTRAKPPTPVAASDPAPQQMTATPPAPLAKAPTPAGATQVANNLIEVMVKATPSSATIEIDGAQVIGNPFKGRYVGDGAMHQVRITAPGHVQKVTAVSFDAPVALTIQLDRVPEPRPQPIVRTPVRPGPHVVAPPEPQPEVKPPVAPPPEPKPVVKQPTDVDPNGGAKPHHQIDPNNPYAK